MEERATPWGLQWRTSTRFITAVVDFSVFMDVVLYGALVTSLSHLKLSQQSQVPVFPFVLQDRVAIHEDEIQTSVSQLLAAYAVGSLFTKYDSPSDEAETDVLTVLSSGFSPTEPRHGEHISYWAYFY